MVRIVYQVWHATERRHHVSCFAERDAIAFARAYNARVAGFLFSVERSLIINGKAV